MKRSCFGKMASFYFFARDVYLLMGTKYIIPFDNA
jgi:hypothetical protein